MDKIYLGNKLWDVTAYCSDDSVFCTICAIRKIGSINFWSTRVPIMIKLYYIEGNIEVRDKETYNIFEEELQEIIKELKSMIDSMYKSMMDNTSKEKKEQKI